VADQAATGNGADSSEPTSAGAASAGPTSAGPGGAARIVRVVLEEPARIRLSARVESERRTALYDLVQDNSFALVGLQPGPYVLHLRVEGEGLVFDVHDARDRPLTRFSLPLYGFRRIVKDYFLICDSYFQAIREATPSRIEAIDMGRRGLHNEGAELLRARLADHATIDADTARRLFTLVCVLHIRR